MAVFDGVMAHQMAKPAKLPTHWLGRVVTTGAARVFDAAVAGALILFVLPLIVIVALAILIEDGRPVIFRHQRVGLGGRRFHCLKFRSMVTDAHQRLSKLLRDDPEAQAEWARDHKLRQDPRVTSLGKFLRASSLDELPQLLNVLKGEMSIVGPRPIVVGEAERFGHYFTNYCRVRPGITGLWQVSGRSNVCYRRRVAMDTLYARNKNLLWDIKLLLLTVPAVLRRRGSC